MPMSRKQADTRFVAPFVTAALVAVCAVLLSGCASRGPEPLEIRDARLALQDAKNAGADQLAPELMNSAQAHLTTAQAVWRDRGDTAQTVHYARLADSEARNAQFLAGARRAQGALDGAARRRGELEIAVREAELRAQAAHAQSEAERVRIESEARQRLDRERLEAAEAARAASQREADERVRALEASLEAERRKSAEQQQQAQIDALNKQLESERRAAEEARKASEAEAAAARRAAEEERARAEQIARQSADRERSQSELVIRLQQLEKETRVESRGIVVTLPGGVYFDSGKADVKPAMSDRLAEVGKALASAPERHILIEGHTDSTGKMDFNMRLSQLRAESVKAVLVANGVAPDRIEIHGYGPTKPVADNKSPSGRSQNRRVEIVIQGGAAGGR
jgi:outer membrane protein OmpA-like peptidoglycan-associated protein